LDATESIRQGRDARAKGDPNTARARYSEAAEIYRLAANRLAYAHTIRHIADMYLDESEFELARPLYEEALEIYRSSLDSRILDLANTIRPYAILNAAIGKWDIARDLWQEAKVLYTAIRVRDGVTECETHLLSLQPSH
jgi:tetratricopeptide (TPR) repeat protein